MNTRTVPFERVAKIESPTFGFSSVTGYVDHFRFIARISETDTAFLSIHGTQNIANAMKNIQLRSSLDIEKALAIVKIDGGAVELIRLEKYV